MSLEIKGKIQKGIGESQNTIKEQMPFFLDCFPEVKDCKPGTINILLERPLVVVTPDFTTAPLPWHPAFRIVKGGEVFRFVRATLGIEGQPPTRCWIYKAQFSPYRDNPFYIEVLAPPISFQGTPDCTIKLVSKGYEGVVVIGAAQQGSPSGKGPTG